MITEIEYTELRQRYDAYEAWRNGKNAVNTNEIPAELNISNEERSQIEVYEFVNQKPHKYFAYVKVDKVHPSLLGCTVTTWTGDVLGVGSMGYPYRSNFGDRRRSLRIKGINGIVYYGIYFEGAGDYCILKATKESVK